MTGPDHAVGRPAADGAGSPRMVAVVPVRDGVAPLGADEAVAEAGGAALLIGSGTRAAVEELTAVERAWLAEAGPYAAGAWAAALAGVLRDCPVVVLPGSPDGRDLAPRLAVALGRPLVAGAARVLGGVAGGAAGDVAGGAELVRWDGRVTVDVTVGGPFVATLLPGVRGPGPARRRAATTAIDLGVPAAPAVDGTSTTRATGTSAPVSDAVVVEVEPPDPRTADLVDAPRIFGAGAGLGAGELSGPDAVALLGDVATSLGASLGATRVVTDAGWADHRRQIGTTGVVVRPELYVAFGVSGAGQHTNGLGAPRHVVSVNTDPHCPMTAMADLGIVADAAATLRELARLVGVPAPHGDRDGEGDGDGDRHGTRDGGQGAGRHGGQGAGRGSATAEHGEVHGDVHGEKHGEDHGRERVDA